MIDIIKSIQNLDVKNMTDKELEIFLPTLGMNNEGLNEIPPELHEYCGKGLRFWQYPNQLSKFLKYLHGKEINTYLEIGCRWGGTFVIMNELIKQTNPNLLSYACDLIEPSELIKEYSSIANIHFIQGNSKDREMLLPLLPPQIDFIFIDGDHYGDGPETDYQTALQLNPKYIMFHDIVSDACPDVVDIWNKVKNKHKAYFEFNDQYDSVFGTLLGIGVIEL
jgi:cephalosporin hydroxylase